MTTQMMSLLSVADYIPFQTETCIIFSEGTKITKWLNHINIKQCNKLGSKNKTFNLKVYFYLYPFSSIFFFNYLHFVPDMFFYEYCIHVLILFMYPK